ncbi:hypothetical protein, partial [Klebsiella pneumoniae]|uniref:hypothetical protein n=1 Tax=Klebsiella pneumoniae TaxID=573 RepID=UPI003D36B5F3
MTWVLDHAAVEENPSTGVILGEFAVVGALPVPLMLALAGSLSPPQAARAPSAPVMARVRTLRRARIGVG